MNGLREQKQMGEVTTLYHDLKTWELNPGDRTTHAKRMPGFFRSLKTYTQWALWLPFFTLPYLRWNGQTDAQTILPAYDEKRGEPRSKLRRNGEVVAPQGDCIDCYQCATGP